MVDDVNPVSVWGSREAKPQEVDDLEEHWVELTERDIQRRSRDKDKIRKMKQGTYGMEHNKFSPEPNMAALYRADGQQAAVPMATYQYYLRKRDENGNRIFFVRPPVSTPQATSDPCPVTINGVVCGRRLTDQFELIMHVIKKHGQRGRFYLSQEQIDQATGKSASGGAQLIGTTPITPPADVELDPRVVHLSTVAQEVKEMRVVEAVREEIPEPVEVDQVAVLEQSPVYTPSRGSKIGHTCKMNGRLGRYEAGCPRCDELIASKLEKVVLE